MVKKKINKKRPKKKIDLCKIIHKIDDAHSRQVRFRDHEPKEEMKAANEYAREMIKLSKKVCK